ncbi:MAG: hypothetical protein HY716_14245 [Planctomycetes bacterium]|nr:hypothetical protein [Planctomycetota bacterium]
MRSTFAGGPAAVLFALVAASSAGCTYLGSARSFDSRTLDAEPGWISVNQVPEILQNEDGECGAAALAMILAYWRVPATVEEIAETCPRAEGGIRAGDLRDYARAKRMRAYLFPGRLSDLEREVSRRRPALVGLVKAHVHGMKTHYEVIVAIHPSKRIVVTLDPAAGWRQNTFEGFLQEWEPARRLTLVVLPPKEGGT